MCSTSREAGAEQAEALKTTPAELEARLAPLRARLLAAREKRPAPMRDDKILTGWNGLMIAAYADGYRVLHVEKYRRAAEAAADFLLRRLRTPDGRLLRTYRAGPGQAPRLPGRLRLPGPRAAPAPRRDRRRPLAARGPGPGRPDDRRLRGPRGRRVLLHRRRAREPAGPAQGPVRQRPAQRQQHGDPRPAGAPSSRPANRPTATTPARPCDAFSHADGPAPLRDADDARRASSEYLDQEPEPAIRAARLASRTPPTTTPADRHRIGPTGRRSRPRSPPAGSSTPWSP